LRAFASSAVLDGVMLLARQRGLMTGTPAGPAAKAGEASPIVELLKCKNFQTCGDTRDILSL
jgi:hypothetical protein